MAQKMFAVTICAKRRDDMSEEAYHKYVRDEHAPLLQSLASKHKIVSFTIQHNEESAMTRLRNEIDQFPPVRSAYDCISTVVFRDQDDYFKIREDAFFRNIFMPDQMNFADVNESKVLWGWFEQYIREGDVTNKTSDSSERSNE